MDIPLHYPYEKGTQNINVDLIGFVKLEREKIVPFLYRGKSNKGKK